MMEQQEKEILRSLKAKAMEYFGTQVIGEGGDAKVLKIKEKLLAEIKQKSAIARERNLKLIKQQCVEALELCVSQTIKPKLQTY